MLTLIFGQSNYLDRKFRPLLPIADFSSSKAVAKVKNFNFIPETAEKYGAEYVGGAYL